MCREIIVLTKITMIIVKIKSNDKTLFVDGESHLVGVRNKKTEKKRKNFETSICLNKIPQYIYGRIFNQKSKVFKHGRPCRSELFRLLGEVALVWPGSWHGSFCCLTIQRQSIAPSKQDYKKHKKISFQGQSR